MIMLIQEELNIKTKTDLCRLIQKNDIPLSEYAHYFFFLRIVLIFYYRSLQKVIFLEKMDLN